MVYNFNKAQKKNIPKQMKILYDVSKFKNGSAHCVECYRTLLLKMSMLTVFLQLLRKVVRDNLTFLKIENFTEVRNLDLDHEKY